MPSVKTFFLSPVLVHTWAAFCSRGLPRGCFSRHFRTADRSFSEYIVPRRIGTNSYFQTSGAHGLKGHLQCPDTNSDFLRELSHGKNLTFRGYLVNDGLWIPADELEIHSLAGIFDLNAYKSADGIKIEYKALSNFL